MYAAPTPITTPGRALETLRSSTIHALPKGHRPEPRRVSDLLAHFLPQGHRRHLQQGVQVQRAPLVRRRRRRLEPSRRWLLALLVPEDLDGTSTWTRRGPRMPVQAFQHGESDRVVTADGCFRPLCFTWCQGGQGEPEVPYGL